MQYLSRKDIENISLRIVSAYCRLPRFAGKRIYRIDPEILIGELLKLKIKYHRLSADGTVLGATSAFANVGMRIFDSDNSSDFFFFDGKTILIEKELEMDKTQRGRCNFTKVHEASHQIFNMLYPRDYGSTDRSRDLHFSMARPRKSKAIADWTEWQADVLAAYILLPEKLVRQTMSLFFSDGKIQLLNRIYSPKEYDNFSEAAALLGVSKKSLSIRLKQLGLLNPRCDWLENPFELVDVVFGRNKTCQS